MVSWRNSDGYSRFPGIEPIITGHGFSIISGGSDLFSARADNVDIISADIVNALAVALVNTQSYVLGNVTPAVAIGDLMVAAGPSPIPPIRLAIGTPGQVLTVSGSTAIWAAPAITYVDPMTTIGDMLYRNGSNVTVRLPIGTNGFLLTITGGLPTWQPAPAATLQAAYNADPDGSGATIATNATDGALIIAGDQKLMISATSGLDVTTGKIFTSTTNGPIYLTPAGNGYISAQVPDNTLAGGNARGTNAIDFNLSRNTAAQVASGVRSVLIGGFGNTATGDKAVVIGSGGTLASGLNSIALGGSSNTASGLFSAILGSGSSLASGDNTTVVGGQGGRAVGNYSTVVGGSSSRTNHVCATANGVGGFSLADIDFVVGNDPTLSGAAFATDGSKNHFRIAGDSSEVHIGRATDQAAVSGASNKLMLHTIFASNQSRSVGIKAPDTLAASYTLTLPADDGTSNQFLQTDGSGILTWAAVAASTLQLAYKADSDDGPATITDLPHLPGSTHGTSSIASPFAQLFTPVSTITLGSVAWNLYYDSNAAAPTTDTFRVEIFATSGGNPTGSALGTSTPILMSSVLAGHSGTSFVGDDITFSGLSVALTGGVQYAAVLRLTISAGTNVRIGQATGSGGRFSIDSGASWSGSGISYRLLVKATGAAASATVTTDSADGAINIAGTESFQITAAQGLQVSLSSANPKVILGGTGTGLHLRLDGSTSGSLGITVPATVTNHNLTLPSNNASGVLTNNGTGGLSWAAVSGGANVTLSNLTTTSINAALIPDGNNTRDLGTTAASWKDIYIDGSIYIDDVKWIHNTGAVTNTFVGSASGAAITSAASSTFIGANAGDATTSGSSNVFVGRDAGGINTTGNQNVFIGHLAGGQANLTGSDNVFMGFFTGLNSTGSFNTAVGSQSFNGGSSTHNAVVGYSAGGNITTGVDNVMVGSAAGVNTTTGQNNVYIGRRAGTANVAGTDNIAIGYNAGFAASSSYTNTTLMGSTAGAALTIGVNNTMVGFQSGTATVDGNSNAYFGYQAGANSVSGSQNTYLGTSAGQTNTTSNNTMVGFRAGQNSTGAGVTIIGERAGQFLTGGGNVFIGSATGNNSTSGNNNVYVGNDIGANTTNTGSNNVIMGSAAGINITTCSNNVFVGRQAGQANTTGSSNTFIGASAGLNNTTVAGNTFVGNQAGQANTTGGSLVFIGLSAGASNSTGSQGTFVGYSAGTANITGLANTFVGFFAGTANTTGASNVYVGAEAGAVNSTGASNVFIGRETGIANTGSSNTFVGHHAGFSATSSNNNVFIGKDAGQAVTTGTFNTMVGTSAGQAAVAAGGNTMIGYAAGLLATSTNNTLMGESAGSAALTGGSNVMIGRNSGLASTSATSCTFVGHQAGSLNTTGSFNTAIGNQAGPAAGVTQTVGIGHQANGFTANNSGGLKLNAAIAIPGSNTFRFGAVGEITVLAQAFTADSDERIKDNIEDCDLGMAFISDLRPVKYKFKDRTIPAVLDGYGNELSPEQELTFTRLHYGLIAQEVKTVLDGYGEEGLDWSLYQDGYVNGGADVLGLNYIELMAPIIKALQELKEENESLKARIEVLEG